MSMENIEHKILLRDLKEGDEAQIECFNDDDASLLRLRDMGLHDGIAFRVIKFAPTGDPMEIKTRGFYLSIRKSLAEKIAIKRK